MLNDGAYSAESGHRRYRERSPQHRHDLVHDVVEMRARMIARLGWAVGNDRALQS